MLDKSHTARALHGRTSTTPQLLRHPVLLRHTLLRNQTQRHQPHICGQRACVRARAKGDSQEEASSFMRSEEDPSRLENAVPSDQVLCVRPHWSQSI